MKKILLGLGTSILAFIPVIAVVSCSSSSSPIDTEADKFTTQETKDKNITSAAAAASITGTAEEKLASLEKLVDVPTLAEGFEFEVKSANVNEKTATSIDVLITISETANTENTKDVTLVVTGFADEATAIDDLMKEAGKAVDGDSINTEVESAAEANDLINANGEILKDYYVVDGLTEGFVYVSTGSVIDEDTKTVLNITVSFTSPIIGIDPEEKIINLTFKNE